MRHRWERGAASDCSTWLPVQATNGILCRVGGKGELNKQDKQNRQHNKQYDKQFSVTEAGSVHVNGGKLGICGSVVSSIESCINDLQLSEPAGVQDVV